MPCCRVHTNLPPLYPSHLTTMDATHLALMPHAIIWIDFPRRSRFLLAFPRIAPSRLFDTCPLALPKNLIVLQPLSSPFIMCASCVHSFDAAARCSQCRSHGNCIARPVIRWKAMAKGLRHGSGTATARTPWSLRGSKPCLVVCSYSSGTVLEHFEARSRVCGATRGTG